MTAEGFERGRLSSDRRVMTAFATVVALLVVSIAYLVARAPVEATHQPADKAVAFGEELINIDAGAEVPIMTVTMRTAKPTDLFMQVTLECAILTKLHNAAAAANGSSSATTTAQVDVWIEEPGWGIVPISSSSSPPQDRTAPGGPDDKVTFCQREEGRRVTDMEDQPTGDGTDEIQSYFDAKNANGFNWVLLNAGSGIHTYVVKATLQENPGSGCAKDLSSQTCSDALIGNRTFIVEPTKMANDASV